MPEGFERVEYSVLDTSIESTFFNGDNYVFFYQITKKKYYDSIDNEHTDYSEYNDDDGQKYLIIQNQFETIIIWNNGNYVFTISSNLDKDVILKMCKSTKIKN